MTNVKRNDIISDRWEIVISEDEAVDDLNRKRTRKLSISSARKDVKREK